MTAIREKVASRAGWAKARTVRPQIGVGENPAPCSAIFFGRVRRVRTWFSLDLRFDRAIAGSRFYRLRFAGAWMQVGAPRAITAAEATILASAA